MLFKDIAYSGSGWAAPSLVRGFDEKRRVQNITFENVRIGGRKWNGRESLEIGPFVNAVKLR